MPREVGGKKIIILKVSVLIAGLNTFKRKKVEVDHKSSNRLPTSPE